MAPKRATAPKAEPKTEAKESREGKEVRWVPQSTR